MCKRMNSFCFFLFQSTHGTLTFDTVMTEIGSVWNREANNFPVPMRGMYVFQLTIMAQNGNIGGANIRRDTTDIQQAFAPVQHVTGTATVILELEALTQMSAWLSRGRVRGEGGPHSYCHFTGFMLFPL